MNLETAAQILATLGHPDRLAVFRLLVRMLPQAARPTEIAQATGLRQNTLSHHLADLVACGLITVRREGRSLFYSVEQDSTASLLAYLALDVGRGRPDLVQPIAPTSDRNSLQDRAMNVLFLCQGNSARSIFAEALLRDLGAGHFHAFSAGTRPGTALNPFALEVLARNGHDTGALRSKHIAEFQRPDAPRMDFVFTVCDTAAAEECPPWAGQPVTGHWGLPDPVKATGTPAEKALVFAQTYAALRRRIEAFVALPFDSLTRLSLQSHVDAIGLDPQPQKA